MASYRFRAFDSANTRSQQCGELALPVRSFVYCDWKHDTEGCSHDDSVYLPRNGRLEHQLLGILPCPQAIIGGFVLTMWLVAYWVEYGYAMCWRL